MATPQLSPIFSRIPGGGLAPAAALNQVAKDQAAAQKAVAAYAAQRASKPNIRMAGSSSKKLSPIFSRFGKGAPLIGPALTAATGAYRLSQGESPERVATSLGTEAGLAALGAGVGTVLGGPIGGLIGGFAAPTVFQAAVGDLKPVDARYLDPSDVTQPAFGGLTVPNPNIPGVPNLPSSITQFIEYGRPTQDSRTVEQDSAPATRRPAEEQRPPVTREVPASPTPPPAEAPSMNELAQMYARQRILGSQMAEGGELQRRLYEGGAAEGMRTEDFMSWVKAHPDLAYRLAEKRGLLPQFD